MADFLSRWNIPERYGQLKKRLKDMGDGTHAEVVSVVLGAGTAVTINNAAGASAVNIQDGGNSITVDGSVTAASGASDSASVAGQLYPIAGLYQSTITEVTAAQLGRVRMSARRGLITAPDLRVIYAVYNSVTAVGDMQVQAGVWSGAWATPTGAFFDGSDAGFDANPRYVRIPMTNWSQVTITVLNSLGTNLTVDLFPLLTGYGDADGEFLPTLASLVITTGNTATFAPQAGGAGAGANHVAVPALQMPMTWLMIKLTPAADPAAGRFSVRVART